MDKQPNSRTCFLCGRQNPVGLRMSWFNDHQHGQVIADVSVPEWYNGYPGVVHGGILAAILDETSGRAVLLDGDWDKLFVTAKLEVRYRCPTPTETRLRVRGWVAQRSGARALVGAEILLPDGTVSASAEALLVRPPPEFEALWEPEKPYWRVDPEAGPVTPEEVGPESGAESCGAAVHGS